MIIIVNHQCKEIYAKISEKKLYVKEKFGIPDSVYHELSIIFQELPHSCQLKNDFRVKHKMECVPMERERNSQLKKDLKKIKHSYQRKKINSRTKYK